MRVDLRETGSILVRARKSDVLDVLARTVSDASVSGDRVESPGSTYVLRESADGTRIIHARRERAGVALANVEREELRRAVESDLFRLQRLLDAQQR